MENVNLTEKQTQILNAIIANAFDCSGGDFAFTDEVNHDGMSDQAYGGVLSSLMDKGLIDIDKHKVNGEEWVAQITIFDEAWTLAGYDPATLEKK